MDRPPAEDLLPMLFEPGSPKLAAHARPYAVELRCPRRHLLARTVRTTYGVLLQWRGGLLGQPWRAAWLDETADPGSLPVRCGACPAGMIWLLDLTDPRAPRRRTPPTTMR
jgi:hypothetical protein